MKYFELLTAEERAEVDAAVHDAYTTEDGDVRGHAEAMEEFGRAIADAVQAHRRWPEVLLDAWREEGQRAFLRSRWKDAKVFGLIHKGRKRTRAERRGVLARSDEGRQEWRQVSLIDWTADQLQQAIRDCAKRIEEERANVAMYRALLELLTETGQFTVRAALEIRKVSLEDYLAEVDAGRAA